VDSEGREKHAAISDHIGHVVKSVVESLADYGPQPDTDLIFFGPEDFDDCTHKIIELLKSRGSHAEPTGSRPDFQYSI
jgi:hypothetical protein